MRGTRPSALPELIHPSLHPSIRIQQQPSGALNRCIRRQLVYCGVRRRWRDRGHRRRGGRRGPRDGGGGNVLTVNYMVDSHIPSGGLGREMGVTYHQHGLLTSRPECKGVGKKGGVLASHHLGSFCVILHTHPSTPELGGGGFSMRRVRWMSGLSHVTSPYSTESGRKRLYQEI